MFAKLSFEFLNFTFETLNLELRTLLTLKRPEGILTVRCHCEVSMEEEHIVNEELCQQIREAFAGVTLGEGIGLTEAQGIDDYEDKATCARLREADEKEDWSRLSAEEVNRCYSSLSFFDAEGMRFHLPAFLIADIHGLFDFDLPARLGPLNSHKAPQLALLSDAQRKVIRLYLLDAISPEEGSNDYFSRFRQRVERNWPEELVH